MEAAKDAKADVEKNEKKRIDDAAREIANQAAEIENLRTKVKQYGDYDELKRELEIMKVSQPCWNHPLTTVCGVLGSRP